MNRSGMLTMHCALIKLLFFREVSAKFYWNGHSTSGIPFGHPKKGYA